MNEGSAAAAAPPATAPRIGRYLLGGLVAGIAAAVVNVGWYFVMKAAAGYDHPLHPTAGSAVVSSLVPCVLGSLFYYLLARFTAKATLIYSVVVAAIILASFIPAFFVRTLPEGDPKPANFDLVVIPMHVMVGLAAVLITPRVARRA